MKTAALIIAAGLPKCDGIPSAMYQVGVVSSAQHMIASFQKAGVSQLFLAVDESTRKLEKQLSSKGTLFLRTAGSVLDCAKQALATLPEDWDRLVVCTGDRPLILPETIRSMLAVEAELVVPCCKGKEGQMYLLSRTAAEKLCQAEDGRSLNKAMAGLDCVKRFVETGDTGLLLPPKKAAGDAAGLDRHQSALLRPQLDIAVSGEQIIFDRRLINLLEQVELLRSVRAACERTGVSYSIAWNLLNMAEENLGYPLVVRNQGGRSGHGTELTTEGRKILRSYKAFEAAMAEKMAELYAQCFSDIL